MSRLNMWHHIALASLLVVVSVNANCHTGYSSNNNKTCYKVYTTLKSRAAAEAQCESEGGYLAAPSNAFDNAYVTSLGQQAPASSMWLGTQCFNGMKTACGNDDDSTFGPYDNFYANNPSSVGNCVYMSTIRPAVGNWLSFNCLNELPFVCEMDMGAQEVQPTTCPPLFTYFKGMCYQVVQRSMYPADAQSNCQQTTGGNLVSIPSAEVNQYLLNITATLGQNDIWIGLKCPNVAYTGDSSSCVWYDNTPLTYKNFGGSTPYSGYPYTTLRQSGQWVNNNGQSSIYSVCQTKPS